MSTLERLHWSQDVLNAADGVAEAGIGEPS
jgi:hypothetical protein